MGARGDLYALLIGINDYECDAVGQLRFAVADVAAFRDLLQARMQLRDERHVLLSRPAVGSEPVPNRAATLRALAQFSQAPMHAEDTFILYFAGHGFAVGEKSYLLTVDSDPSLPELLEETAISLDTLKRITRGIRAGQQLWILDACRNEPGALGRDIGSGGLDATMARDVVALVRHDRPAEGEQRHRSRAVLSACWEGQRSFEYPRGGQSWFAYNLLECLRETPRGDVDVVKLAEQVKDRMRVNAWRYLPEAAQQEPHLTTDGSSIRLCLSPRSPAAGEAPQTREAPGDVPTSGNKGSLPDLAARQARELKRALDELKRLQTSEDQNGS